MALSQKAANCKDLNADKGEMQRRHFATIATTIRNIPDYLPLDGMPGVVAPISRQAIAEHFANELAATNPRFDRARFLAACLADNGK